VSLLAAFAFANLKHDLGWLWGVITHASFWQLACMALGIWMIVVQFQLADSRHDASAYLKQRDAYKAQLDSISSKRNEQKIQTETRIVSVREKIKEADGRAEKVESAPLPGGCRTPPEISQADL
jgi:hypothetical protein